MQTPGLRLRVPFGGIRLQEASPGLRAQVSLVFTGRLCSRSRAVGASLVLGEAERRSWSPLGAGGCGGPQMLPPTHQGVCLPTQHGTGETTTAASQRPEVTRRPTLGSGQHKDRNPRRPEPWGHLRGSQAASRGAFPPTGALTCALPHGPPPGLPWPRQPTRRQPWAAVQCPQPTGAPPLLRAEPWLPATTVHSAATLTGSCVRVPFQWLPVPSCSLLPPSSLPLSLLPGRSRRSHWSHLGRSCPPHILKLADGFTVSSLTVGPKLRPLIGSCSSASPSQAPGGPGGGLQGTVSREQHAELWTLTWFLGILRNMLIPSFKIPLFKIKRFYFKRGEKQELRPNELNPSLLFQIQVQSLRAGASPKLQAGQPHLLGGDAPASAGKPQQTSLRCLGPRGRGELHSASWSGSREPSPQPSPRL